jgi:hypothetical protein
VHALDRNLEGRIGVGPPGEHGVDRLDRLPVLTGESGHHGLCQQLPAEDDTVRGAQAGGPVAVGTDLFEGQRVDEGGNGGHPVSILLWGAKAHTLASAGLAEAELRHHSDVFDGDVKVRYPPGERLPRHESVAFRVVAAPPAVVTWVIRTTRG